MLGSPFQSGIPSGPVGSSFERHHTSVEWLGHLAKLRLISELIGFMNKEKLQISSHISVLTVRFLQTVWKVVTEDILEKTFRSLK